MRQPEHTFYDLDTADLTRPTYVDRHDEGNLVEDYMLKVNWSRETCVPPALIASEESLHNPEHNLQRLARMATAESPLLV